METKSRSLFNNALIYGLITAAISIVFSVITYILDVPFKSPVMYLGMLILLGGLVYGTIQYKNQVLGGYISFSKAFLSGFLILLVAAVISTLYSYVFMTIIDPSYLEKIIAQTMEETEKSLLEKGIPEDQMEPALAMTRKFMSPGIMTVMALVMNLFSGAIMSLIAALIIKKEDKSFNGQLKNIE